MNIHCSRPAPPLHVINEGTLAYLRNKAFSGTNSSLRSSDPCQGPPCWRPPCRSRSRGCLCLPKFPPLPLQPVNENTVETAGGFKKRSDAYFSAAVCLSLAKKIASKTIITSWLNLKMTHFGPIFKELGFKQQKNVVPLLCTPILAET